MGIRFILMINKQGQPRLAQYYENLSIPERRSLEGEIVRKCLARTEQQIVYRRYATLFFLVGVDNNENELAIPEFIHLLVETMDRHFSNVCELDIMVHLEKAHFIVEEMVMNGCIVQAARTASFPLFISWTEYHREEDNPKTTPSSPKRHDSVTYVQQLQR